MILDLLFLGAAVAIAWFGNRKAMQLLDEAKRFSDETALELRRFEVVSDASDEADYRREQGMYGVRAIDVIHEWALSVCKLRSDRILTDAEISAMKFKVGPSQPKRHDWRGGEGPALHVADMVPQPETVTLVRYKREPVVEGVAIVRQREEEPNPLLAVAVDPFKLEPPITSPVCDPPYVAPVDTSSNVSVGFDHSTPSSHDAGSWGSDHSTFDGGHGGSHE